MLVTKEVPVRWAIDIGHVLAARRFTGDHDLYRREYHRSPVVDGAVEGVRYLVSQFGRDKVFVLSRTALLDFAAANGIWLERNGFLDDRGFAPENLYFCKEREDKVSIATMLGIEVMVDDRPEVLLGFSTETILIWFCPRPTDLEAHAELVSRAYIAHSWEEVRSIADRLARLP